MKSIEEEELTMRIYNCMKNAGLLYTEWVALIPDKQLLKTRNFGKKSLKELREIIPSVKAHCPECQTGVTVVSFYTKEATATVSHPFHTRCRWSEKQYITHALNDVKIEDTFSDYDHEACLAAMYPDFLQVSASPANG